MEYVPYLISFASLLLAGYTFLHRNNKENTAELTTVIVKLENIGNGIADIKAEINSIKNDQKEDHDSLIRLSSTVQSLESTVQSLQKQLLSS